MQKPKLAVHKFTSCDGCQLAFLNAGEALLALSDIVDIIHFVEAGEINLETPIDISFIEGSVSTPEEIERVKKIRERSKYVIAFGACATAGGVQALRNFANHKEWMASIYAKPQYIKSLDTSTPASAHIRVDTEIWGCPPNTKQVLDAIKSLLLRSTPRIKREKVCMECKRKNYVCVLVAKKQACMGPVTQTGCGVLCPGITRPCYACYGPSEVPNTKSLGNWFIDKLNIAPEKNAQQFLHLNNQAPAFKEAGQYFKGIPITSEK
jgi:coenzyme F420-reducing hydrogenase gamma subunit